MTSINAGYINIRSCKDIDHGAVIEIYFVVPLRLVQTNTKERSGHRSVLDDCINRIIDEKHVSEIAASMRFEYTAKNQIIEIRYDLTENWWGKPVKKRPLIRDWISK